MSDASSWDMRQCIPGACYLLLRVETQLFFSFLEALLKIWLFVSFAIFFESILIADIKIFWYWVPGVGTWLNLCLLHEMNPRVDAVVVQSLDSEELWQVIRNPEENNSGIRVQENDTFKIGKKLYKILQVKSTFFWTQLLVFSPVRCFCSDVFGSSNPTT